MSQHSPEPWKYDEEGHFITDSRRIIVVEVEAALPDDLRRTVACVNACRGIPTDELLKIAAWKDTAKDNACAEAATMLSGFGWTVTSPDGSVWEPEVPTEMGMP